MFNPVIFASITGICRAQLYDFMRKNGIERDVVFFATDSICTRKKLEGQEQSLVSPQVCLACGAFDKVGEVLSVVTYCSISTSNII